MPPTQASPFPLLTLVFVCHLLVWSVQYIIYTWNVILKHINKNCTCAIHWNNVDWTSILPVQFYPNSHYLLYGFPSHQFQFSTVEFILNHVKTHIYFAKLRYWACLVFLQKLHSIPKWYQYWHICYDEIFANAIMTEHDSNIWCYHDDYFTTYYGSHTISILTCCIARWTMSRPVIFIFYFYTFPNISSCH